MKKFGLLVSAILFCAPGCGDDGGGGGITVDAAPGGGGEDIALSDFAKVQAGVICGKFFQCCTPAEILEELEGEVTTKAQCITQLTPLLKVLVQTGVEESLAGAKLEYDAKLVGECFALVEAISCTDFFYNGSLEEPKVCLDSIKGLAANGAACAREEECVSQYCEGYDDQTPGVCKDEPVLGEACPDDTCKIGSYCSAERICVAFLADGQNCEEDKECINACNDINEVGTCGAPMSCDGL